jgi:signal transduction histidine kinase
MVIDDLLDLNRIVHGKLEYKALSLDLHDCIRQALDVCVTDFNSRNLKLTVSLEATRHHVLGDATRLQQVFCNLFQNAAKFTPNGGRVAVRSPKAILVFHSLEGDHFNLYRRT